MSSQPLHTLACTYIFDFDSTLNSYLSRYIIPNGICPCLCVCILARESNAQTHSHCRRSCTIHFTSLRFLFHFWVLYETLCVLRSLRCVDSDISCVFLSGEQSPILFHFFSFTLCDRVYCETKQKQKREREIARKKTQPRIPWVFISSFRVYHLNRKENKTKRKNQTIEHRLNSRLRESERNKNEKQQTNSVEILSTFGEW